ncbi:MAG: alpha,alpha-trehalase [Clostridia bacterium]|nr:alpha,alpha-trehalase [Clostridia bacterium]
MKQLIDFIHNNWDGTLRYNPPKDGKRFEMYQAGFDRRNCTLPDEDTLIPLPKPYTVPSISDVFNELYYWDTYFTNLGLIRSGKVEYARDNVENIAYLINTYGYMPNGNRTYYLTRSQPPFFSHMVLDVYSATGDKAWLAEMFSAAKREYTFWQEKRMTESGLNRYYHNFDNSDRAALESSASIWARRVNLDPPKSDEELLSYAENVRVVCESGWDCNSRFGTRTFEYNWVDLNCLLYGMESNMAHLSRELGNGEEELWLSRAESRRALMNELCFNKELGAFCDYDFVNKRQSDFFSCASFYALWVGLCTPEQAESTVKLLPRLEEEFGVACCERRPDSMGLQWDHPHGWACLQYIVIEGLRRYGYESDAIRIAEKYAATVERNFLETGNIWEHYDTVSGRVSVTKEKSYQITMMGWSAGVYLHAADLLGKL